MGNYYNIQIFAQNHLVITSLLIIWTISWKGIALWKSAQNKQINWFVPIIILNTLGILEIIYIYFFAKKQTEKSAHHQTHKTEQLISDNNQITYDDFQKLDLRVAKIFAAEKVENSEKLIRLQLEVGDSKRQIVAGIGKAYTAEDLVDKEIIIVANLEPKKLMGIESHGMLLAASENAGHPILLQPEKEMKSGSKIS